MRCLRKLLNTNLHQVLRTIGLQAVRVLHRVQPLKKCVADAAYCLLKKDFTIGDYVLKSLFQQSNIEAFKQKPLMTVLIPVYNTEPQVLKKSIESVLRQVYKKWELCMVDDASTQPHVRQILKAYASKDHRIKLGFSDTNEGIAATINKAVGMSSGEYFGVLDHDDELDSLALFEYVKTINRYPDADCIYCDEDKIDQNGNICGLWLKSDWNPDLSLSFNYVMHFAVYRRMLFERLGGFRKAYEGSQDYDFLLRVSETTDRIYHIPKILYHWRMGQGSIASGPQAKPDVFVKGLAALNDALKRRGIDAIAEHAPDTWQGVYRVKRKMTKPLPCSILVVSYGDRGSLLRLLNTIFDNTPQNQCEVLVCLHSSLMFDQNKFSEQNKKAIKWVTFNGANTVPKAFNEGVQHTSGDILFFLDETMELISPDSYRALFEHIQREEAGAVGGKVYYGNGLVEHAGVILGPFNLLGYAHRATPDTPGYLGLKNMICNYSAVMGFGMMTRKKLFQDIGGFDEELERAYWDVDYCLKLREKGYMITYTPYARFRHHTPVTAIDEMIIEPEAVYFSKRWQHIIDRDPYFNPNFSRDLEDFSIRKLYNLYCRLSRL